MKENLPENLLASLAHTTGFNKAGFEAVHQLRQPLTSIRINKKKLQRFNTEDDIISNYFNIKNPVPWCSDGYYLQERPAFIFDPLIHAGAYYVQEASSMFLQEILQQVVGENTSKKVLDLCAAPGGKSTLLASYFKDGLLVSNEVIKQRVNILYENSTKWGAENTVITSNDAADFKRLENYFDVMLIDAPCSGSGLFRKDADAVDEWSLKNVEMCSRRQQRIMADAYSCIKKDGLIIYSTCSYSTEENEDILDWMKDNFGVESRQLQLKNEWHIDESISTKNKMFGYRFWPDKLQGEGFFIAVLQKNDGESSSSKTKNSLEKPTNKESGKMVHFIEDVSTYTFFKQNENIHFINKNFIDDVAVLQRNLYLKKAGIKAGSVKGDELVPHHELALSSVISNDVFKVDLSKEDALKYLRKQTLNVAGETKGWALSTHKNFPLGWMKILHNRVNNSYPSEWRILKL